MSKYNSAMDGRDVLIAKEAIKTEKEKEFRTSFHSAGGFHGRKFPAILFTSSCYPSNLLLMKKYLLLDHLQKHQPKTIADNTKYAAVSIIMRLNKFDYDLFLIKRTVHPNDPWSGQIALPGGHYEEKDNNLIETAIRETREETKIILKDSHFVAQIDDQQGYASGGKIDLTVRPFVFFIDENPQIKINYELDSYFWLSITHFQQPDNHLFFHPKANFSDRPGVQLDESNILWGITYRILTDFFNIGQIDTPFIGDYDQQR